MTELAPFTDLMRHLDRVQPGVYRYAAGTSGRAPGLVITRPGVAGDTFVFTPSGGSAAYLLCLRDLDEVFDVPSVEALEETLRRWAFPTPWTAPAPLDAGEERARLAKIREGLGEREVAVDTEPGLAADDVAAIDPARLTRSYPADPSGRLALDTRVVLAEPIPAKNVVARTPCLVATGPVRRRDPQRIRVSWEDLVLANQDHRWAQLPWRWTREAVPEHEVAPSEAGEQALAAFDAGELEAGLGLFSVTLSPDLHEVLGGVRIRPPACCAHVDPAWSRLLAAVIRSCAPWKLDRAAVVGKKGPVAWKLAIFPGQTHSRKACVSLTRGPGGVQLVIDTTATNVRLHEEAWKRPLGMDLRRHGLGGD